MAVYPALFSWPLVDLEALSHGRLVHVSLSHGTRENSLKAGTSIALLYSKGKTQIFIRLSGLLLCPYRFKRHLDDTNLF